MAQNTDWLNEFERVDAPINNAGPLVVPGAPPKPEKPEKPEETFRFATEAEKIAEGLDPNRAYQISATSGKFIDVAGQPTAKPVIEQDTNRIPQISTGLSAVKDLQSLSNRFLSVGRQAGNIAETPLLGSLLGQNRADLEGSLEILKGIIIQDQLARLAKINPAGISSLANTPSEQERFVSSIANLDPNQSPEQFAIGLKRAEDYLNRQLKEAGGEMPAPQAGDKASQLQEAFNRGATLEELNTIAGALGITPNQADLVEAIRFRDAGGVGARILPPEAGAAPEETGFFEGIIETVTGSGRSTPEIEALPEWTTMPELNELSVAGARTGIGTMFTSPEESVKIIQANYPGVQVRQDTKGNYILRSQDGREYGIKPGFRWSDVPRALGGILAFTPAGRATTVAGAAGGSALTQAGIEATQAGAGGTFDTGEIAIAGGAGAAGKVLEQALPAVVSSVRGMRGGPAAALPETIPAGAAPEAPPAMPSPAAMAPEAPVAPVAPVVTPAATPEAAAELGTIIRQASGADAKAKGAQIKLSEMAQINPEARAAAERLGIDVPADVFSDNPQVRAAVGLTRSLAGSEAEAAWRNSVSAAVDQADNILREFDAQFIEGAIAPGVVSQRVKDSLTGTRASLNKQASDIYKQVDAAVPKQTPVQMDNLFRELNLIAGEVGESGMTAQEKRLMSLIQSGEAAGGDITYGRLIREKNLIGKALKREESPYGSLDEATLKRLYGALATDQLDNVGRVAGEEVRSQLRGANLIYAKERALGDRIVNAFGRDLEGGIANKMRAAITSGAKGDAGDFARLMKTVPEDLRREVVATALGSVSRSARGAEKGGFGFSEFADLYPKLRANPPVYKQIVETLGPKAADTLRDLYQVSKRITEARANVLTTGKANQALVESLNAEGIVSRIMDSTMAKRAVGAAAGFAGPVAGAVMPDIMQAMAKGNPDAIRAAGKMFSSPEFQVLLTEAATQPKIADRAINRVATSARFRDFAKTIGLDMKDAKTWLRSAAAPAAVAQGEQTPVAETSGAPVVRIQQ